MASTTDQTPLQILKLDVPEGTLKPKAIHVISKGEVGGAQTSLLNYVDALKYKYDQFVFIGGKSKFLSTRLSEIKVENAQFHILSIFSLLSFAYLLRTRVKHDAPVLITHSFIASAVTRIVLLGTGAKITYVVLWIWSRCINKIRNLQNETLVAHRAF